MTDLSGYALGARGFARSGAGEAELEGNQANPQWRQPTSLFVTFSDADFRLGFSAAQTTLGAVARLVDARVVSRR